MTVCMTRKRLWRGIAGVLFIGSVLIAGVGIAMIDSPTYTGCTDYETYSDMVCSEEEQYVTHDNSDSVSIVWFAGFVFVAGFVPLFIAEW